jgi:hypothetical protein
MESGDEFGCHLRRRRSKRVAGESLFKFVNHGSREKLVRALWVSVQLFVERAQQEAQFLQAVAVAAGRGVGGDL